MGKEFIGSPEFDNIYETYKSHIFQTILMYTKDWYAAEDIMQEVFMRYYIYMEHTRVENPKSWLMVTAKNMALNYIRNNRRTILVDQVYEEMIGTQDSNETIFFDKLWKQDVLESTKIILNALYQKNKRWYDAVTLVYCMEKSQKNAAECMGISLESLQSMLYRARNWIKKNYRKEFDHIHDA